MKFPQRTVIFTVLASLIVGGCAGVVASVLTSSALEDYAAALLGDRGFTALEPRKPNANPLDYENAVRQVRDVQARSIAVITLKSSDTVLPASWIGPNDALGLGVVASANGWVLTTKDELALVQNPVTGVEVWVRGSRYAVVEVVYDKLSPYVLLRLADAGGLTPVGFAASEDARNGDMVFGLPGAVGFVSTTLQNSEAELLTGPQAAETYADGWQLTNTGLATGPILSTSGDLLGFTLTNGEAVPFHHGVAFVQETLRTGAPMHAALGAYVVDLSDIYNLDAGLRQSLSTGALVFAPVGKLAVPVKTPAAESGLLAKDIITAVDGEAITQFVSLSELLAIYDPGQTAKLSVLRAGAPIEISVVLGDLSTLVY
jgi:S1-C subfamily serine protease